MIYRGFSPRTRLIRWGVLAIVVGLALGVTVPMAVSALINLAEAAPGKLSWTFTRVFAFMSYLAITGSVLYGLLLSTKILDRLAHRPVTYALHQDMALVGLGLAVVHVLLLALDNTVPFSIADMLIPFKAPYRPIWVGVGQFSLYVTLVVTLSFYVRRTIGQRAWRLIHYLTFLSFVSAALHGIMTGSDASMAWAWWLYTISIILVVFLTAYRIIDAAATADERRIAAEEAALAAARAARGFPGGPNPRSARPGLPGPGGLPMPPQVPQPPLGPLERRAPVKR